MQQGFFCSRCFWSSRNDSQYKAMVNNFFKLMFWFKILSSVMIFITFIFGVTSYFHIFILNVNGILLFLCYQEMLSLSLSFAEYINKIVFEEMFSFYSIQSTVG